MNEGFKELVPKYDYKSYLNYCKENIFRTTEKNLRHYFEEIYENLFLDIILTFLGGCDFTILPRSP